MKMHLWSFVNGYTEMLLLILIMWLTITEVIYFISEYAWVVFTRCRRCGWNCHRNVHLWSCVVLHHYCCDLQSLVSTVSIRVCIIFLCNTLTLQRLSLWNFASNPKNLLDLMNHSKPKQIPYPSVQFKLWNWKPLNCSFKRLTLC